MILAVAVCLVVFAVDLVVPLGYATGILHVVPLLLMLGARVPWHVFVVAGVAGAFVLLDMVLGAPGGPVQLVVVNRVLTLAGLLVVAALIFRHTRHRLQAQQSLEAVLFAMPDGVIAVDEQGKVKLANHAAERLFDVSQGQLVGRQVDDFLPVEQRAAHGGHRASFAAGDHPGVMAPNRAVYGVTRTGERVRVEITLGRVDGTPPLVIAALRDVSAQAAAEERLNSHQRLEALGRLAGGVAHDFNNMMTAILCSARLGREAAPAGSELAEDLDDVLDAARRATELTKQLLAFSRHQAVEPRSLDLNGLVEGTGAMLRRLLGAQVQLALDLAPALGPVRLAPSQAEQVLVNLCINARDAMGGRGRLTVATRDVELRERRRQGLFDLPPGPYVTLSVADEGSGIAPEVLPHIFEPFYSTKASDEGTGLGLSTVYGIVKHANGQILIDSHVGRGTTFSLWFPRATEPVVAPEPRGLEVAPAAGEGVVLIAEDEELLRRTLVRTLSLAGYRVYEAADGFEALRQLEQLGAEVDLLFTDVRMPRMDGLELARRAQALNPRLRVLFASGFSEEPIRDLHGVADEAAFVQKPYDTAEVLRRIEQRLGGPTPVPAPT